ncbi:peroxisomal multifunctional enzyme type 2-like isoform X1 [Atheta coriaria]|uniref:peroxisomal multifunctional enzyme type 2-like isoform X1 n=2 Tax=Dalotia coriaria TaxID=877792 RepID=UPI0031F370B6
MSELRYDGRVAVVTGAGAGLGRAYALLFGSRGAKVVVNDLGGGRHGDGKSSKAADDVVAEIKRMGGQAVADYNSVVEGDKIIKTALDAFGRVDIVVNNAGILRDKSFPRIAIGDWDIIQDVHLKGGFKTAQAAFPLFKQQKYGRLIFTASNSGLYGNFGQANYAAAKTGTLGLSSTIAIEGKKYNITSNVIVPTAASRLTEDILPPDVFNELKPELIAPVVAYLCHESCTESGSIIESAAGWAGKCHVIRANGKNLRKKVSDGVSIEDVRDNWEKVTDMNGARHFASIEEVTAELMASIGSDGGNSDGVQEGQSFNDKDAILYALGVGASVTNPGDLRFLYENHEDFSVLPTYLATLSVGALMSSSTMDNVVPGKTVSLENVLHGEQYLEVMDDFSAPKTFTNSMNTVEVLDKGSGAVIVTDVVSQDASGKPLWRNQIATFAVGAGQFGGPRSGNKLIPCVPKPNRSCDKSLSYKTSQDQAALFRLSGDVNPLHIDPNFAAVAGYKKPILHGLCSLGISVRLVLQAYAGNDPKLFKALKCRFVKPVLPGQTIKVDMWRAGNRIHFETSTVENNSVTISGSYVDLKSVVEVDSLALNNTSAMALQSDAIFEFIISKVNEDPAKAKAVNGIFLYIITKDGKQAKQWTMDLKAGKVYEGAPTGVKPNTTLTISDEDFVQLATGKLNPQSAFMKGKLKVTGNVMMAQKLGPLLKAADAKL